MVKEKLEQIRETLEKLKQVDPTDVSLNSELDKSMEWVEYALLRLEARDDENNTWYAGEQNVR